MNFKSNRKRTTVEKLFFAIFIFVGVIILGQIGAMVWFGMEVVSNVNEAGGIKEALIELLGKVRAKLGMLEGDLLEGYLVLGQIVGLIHDLPSVSTLVARLRKEYNEAVSTMPRLF
jgi:hypothetical protein